MNRTDFIFWFCTLPDFEKDAHYNHFGLVGDDRTPANLWQARRAVL